MAFNNRPEIKYALIKLVKSGRSFRESMALAKTLSGAMLEDYLNGKDIEDILSISGGLEDIKKKRPVSQIRFQPKSTMGQTRRDAAASFVVWHDSRPINWARDGNLIRRGKPNRPKPGSSREKVGRTQVIGAKKVLNDFRQLITSLQQLQQAGKNKGSTKQLQQAYKSFRTQIKIKGG